MYELSTCMWDVKGTSYPVGQLTCIPIMHTNATHLFFSSDYQYLLYIGCAYIFCRHINISACYGSQCWMSLSRGDSNLIRQAPKQTFLDSFAVFGFLKYGKTLKKTKKKGKHLCECRIPVSRGLIAATMLQTTWKRPRERGRGRFLFIKQHNYSKHKSILFFYCNRVLRHASAMNS